jgi:hypothetical protein
MEPVAYSIDEFCKAHRIRRAMFYKLDHQGRGPLIMRIGTRGIISRESAADWRREREAEAAQSPRVAETVAA